MITLQVRNKIDGLSNFLTSHGVTWRKIQDCDGIEFDVEKTEDLFSIGFSFGMFFVNTVQKFPSQFWDNNKNE